MLVRMAPNSPIAARGVALIQNLLAEEARLPHGGAFATGSSSAPKRKRKSEAVDQGLLGATSLAKRMALGAVDGAEYGLSTSLVARGMASDSSSSPFRLSTFAEAPSGGYSPASTTSPHTGPRLVEGEYGAPEEVIPPEFLNIFLGSGKSTLGNAEARRGGEAD